MWKFTHECQHGDWNATKSEQNYCANSIEEHIGWKRGAQLTREGRGGMGWSAGSKGEKGRKGSGQRKKGSNLLFFLQPRVSWAVWILLPLHRRISARSNPAEQQGSCTPSPVSPFLWVPESKALTMILSSQLWGWAGEGLWVGRLSFRSVILPLTGLVVCTTPRSLRWVRR